MGEPQGGARYVHIVDHVPELDDQSALVRPGQRLVMLQALDGFLDAGEATETAVAAMIRSSTDAPIVATFEVEEFHDYRARRPPMVFNRDHFEGYEAPRLVVRLLKDAGETPYLLLSGPEPDVKWEAYARAVREVVDRFGVDEVISVGSVPMTVPHTRPIHVNQHATRPELLADPASGGPQVRIPSHAQALVELRLGEWGYDASGFVAHVPHYLAQFDYPRGALALLERIERQARLTLDLQQVIDAAHKRDAEVVTYLEEHQDVAEVVEALERQYDTFLRAEASGASLLAPNQPMPTGEELGREFEAFLAGLGDGDDQSQLP